MHGGHAPQVRAAARKRLQTAAAERAVATYGLPRDVTPGDALLEEIARTAGHVAWLAGVIQQLGEDTLTWGVHSKESGFAEGGPIEKVTEQVGVSVWVTLYQWERRHLVDVCKAAIAAGIAERQVRLAEDTGRLISDVIRAVVADPDLGLDPARQATARAVTARHLKLVAGP